MRTRILSALIALSLILSLAPQAALGATTKEVITTHYRLDTGVTFLWKNSAGTWQNGWNPGSTHSWSTTFNIGAGMRNVKVYKYIPYASSKTQGFFDFDNELYHWNQTRFATDEKSYSDNYFAFAANTFSVSGENTYSSGSGNLTVSYGNVTFAVKDGSPYNVKKKLADGNKQDIFDLLGNPSQEVIDAMNLMDPASQSFSLNVEGYLYFTPVILQYDAVTVETVRDDALEARLSLPSSAEAGETYTAADDSLIGADLSVATASLEKHYGDGKWAPVVSWSGRGNGKNSGGSKKETEQNACTVTYRLTVTAVGGKNDEDVKTIRITEKDEEPPEEKPEEPKHATDIEAILDMPATVYEGHAVCASDQSRFRIDGQEYSSARMYAEKLASNSFTPGKEAGAAVSFLTDTDREITWPKIGFYEVVLRVSSRADSNSDTDVKPIEVLRTPAIIDTLGGSQKENRKQTLTAVIATNPLYPVKSAWMQIVETGSGETVRLNRNGALQNSASIKTRAIRNVSSDPYFTTIELPFLTKYRETRDFTYRIFVEDSRGQTAEVTKDFTVLPDLPPQPDVLLETEFLRMAGTNTAEISVLDRSVTDGDQLERTWHVSADGLSAAPGVFADARNLAGYQDRSFGTGMNVAFHKEGVGPVDVKLSLKEIWTDETLPEYITPADYLSAESGVYSTVVNNVAPVVSLSPKAARSADVLLLAASKSEYDNMAAKKNELDRAFIEAGVDAHVTLRQLAPSPRNSAAPTELMEIARPSGYNGNAFLENRSYSVDEGNLYTVHATWVNGDRNNYPQAPYYITAYDAYTAAQKWQYAIPGNVLSATALYNQGQGFAHDAAGKYLYFICGDSTLLFDKNSGACLGKLNIAAGQQNYIAGNAIYTFKSDGIYRIDMGGGIKKIYAGTISGDSGVVGGKLHFFLQMAPSAYHGIFDPATEKVSLLSLNLAASADNVCLRVDTKGKMVIGQGGKAKVYAEDGTLMREFSGWFGSGARSSGLICAVDEKGEATHVVSVSRYDNSKHTSTVRAYDIYTGAVTESSSSGQAGYDIWEILLLGLTIGNKLYVQTGAGINDVGNNMSSETVEPTRARLYTFDLSKGTVSYAASSLFAFGPRAETSMKNDVLYAVNYTLNHDQAAPENDNRVKVAEWPQTEDQILWRSLVRHQDSDRKDIKAVVLLDDANRFNAGGSAFRSALGTSLFTTLNHSGSVLLADSIVSAAVKPGNTPNKALAIKPTGSAAGTVSRRFSLDPSKTYYYEYEVKDPAQTPANAANPDDAAPMRIEYGRAAAVPEDRVLPEKYYVTKTWLEDFNGGPPTEFFHYPADKIRNGWFCGSDFSTAVKSGGNYNHVLESDIAFTVPAGKQAILSFDYDCAGETPRSARFLTDGEIWSVAFGTGRGSGHYTHKDLLQPGTHSLCAYVVYQGSLPAQRWARVDNLKVEFVENTRPADPPPTAAMASAGGGWIRYSGSFATPEPVLAYAAQPLQSYEGAPGSIPFVSLTQKSNWTYHFTARIPQGKYAVDSGVMPKPLGNATFRSGDVTFEYYTTPILERQAAGRMPIGQTGDVTVEAQGTGGVSGGDYSDAHIYLVDELNEPIKQDRYFFDKKAGRVYFANETFPGHISVRFSAVSQDGMLLRDFRIYSIENGVRVYAAENTMNTAAQAAAWQAENALVSLIDETPVTEEKEPDALIYKKGELVSYNIAYTDYEKDASLKSFWKYAHTPFNDGPHPDADAVMNMDGSVRQLRGNILDESIERFYVDGKYVVEHWQRDNTDRAGGVAGNGINYEDYNKNSNAESLTFYIEGGGEAPWITYIKTLPTPVREGEKYRLEIGVDDKEKDELTLVTEVYFEGRQVYRHYKTGIKADAAKNYPAVVTDFAPPAQAGGYSVVCTVSDLSGAGLGRHAFDVVSEGKIAGEVFHTDEWNRNRKTYNMKLFKEEVNRTVDFAAYKNLPAPRARGVNVFWSGERFMLRAGAAGNPVRVTCQIKGYPGYITDMRNTGSKNAEDEWIYDGSLWDSAMINKWGKNAPESLTFLFTAYYAGDVIKEHEASVILDTEQDFRQLHRYF
ncbi:MAG: hypothetical protein LBT26_02140 [Clostridiales Family XIII bacterium]|jgi:hypothetical protein|nr:hypothetical protein [Clostridiales Family XIII bacterium]